jgi:hypothetical protein
MQKLLGVALLTACFCVVGCDVDQTGMDTPDTPPPATMPGDDYAPPADTTVPPADDFAPPADDFAPPADDDLPEIGTEQTDPLE